MLAFEASSEPASCSKALPHCPANGPASASAQKSLSAAPLSPNATPPGKGGPGGSQRNNDRVEVWGETGVRDRVLRDYSVSTAQRLLLGDYGA